jgi:diguanylate cyclase (GGDEF)-like protein
VAQSLTDPLDGVLSSVREVAEVRHRAALAREHRDRLSATVIGLGFAVAAVLTAKAGYDLSVHAMLRLTVLVGLYVLAYRTEFVAASGSAVPTQPILVGLLLTTPLPLVPLAVLAGLQLGALGSQRSGSLANTLVVRAIPGWHCLGPVAVLAAVQPGTPTLRNAAVYVAALGAQLLVDAAVAVVRSAALGVAPRTLVGPLGWTFAVDALLAAVGTCIVVAADGTWADAFLLAAPIALVRLLALDGRRNLAAAVTLEGALTAASAQARHDPLTGLANRRAWDEAVAATAAAGLGAVVVVADLDGLKTVNDADGHDAGDALIRAMAAALRASAPDGATVARLGGDEFGVLVPLTDGVGSEAVEPLGPALVRAVRAAAAGRPPSHGRPLSASIGWATCTPGADVRAAVLLADGRAGEDKLARRAGRAA